MRIKRIITNGVVILISCTIGLLLSEACAHLLLNPADYLSVTTTQDDILGIRIAQGAVGFDEWGFRNPGVPSTAEIVAIGDSHTYGNNATMSASWPYVVARLTGQHVYSLSLGGYGPNQYYHLLKTYALKLKPRWVICGLYMGDDFENAFLMTYGKDYWSFLRKGSWDRVDANIWPSTTESPGGFQRFRTWLSRNSVIYQLIVHGPVLGPLKGALQIRQAAQADGAVTSLILENPRIHEAFRPIGIRARLDQSNAAVREGMRITFELLALMNHACHENGCQLVVVLIPTKETVFTDHLLRDPYLPLKEVVADLVNNEREARQRLLEFLDQAKIPYVDTLPALRSKSADQIYTKSDRDMHPATNGYRVIGETVAAFLGHQFNVSASPSQTGFR
jgi:SGNH hydrolase-like domain, acetyltransferase AlgX